MYSIKYIIYQNVFSINGNFYLKKITNQEFNLTKIIYSCSFLNLYQFYRREYFVYTANAICFYSISLLVNNEKQQAITMLHSVLNIFIILS
jgi:hypothetical protein